jgi:hypothetical protein
MTRGWVPEAPEPTPLDRLIGMEDGAERSRLIEACFSSLRAQPLETRTCYIAYAFGADFLQGDEVVLYERISGLTHERAIKDRDWKQPRVMDLARRLNVDDNTLSVRLKRMLDAVREGIAKAGVAAPKKAVTPRKPSRRRGG